MKKLTVILAGVLTAQVLLAAVLFSLDSDMGAFQSKDKLLGLELIELDSIEIASPDNTLSLTKNQGKWQLSNHFDAPANTDKLQQITDKLFALNTSWPVATTPSAAPRFKVSGDEFERKISFRKGPETVKTLFLGTSPGFKKIHARIDPNDEIYSIDFSAFEATAKVDDWIDKDLLKLNKEELTKIVMDQFTLVKVNQVWEIENQPKTKIANQEKINTWLDKLASLSYTSILGNEDKPEYGFAKPELSLKLSQTSGNETQLQLAKKQNDFILKSSSQPYYFKVAHYQIKALQDAKLEDFVDAKPVEEKPETLEDTGTGEAAKKEG